MKSVMIIFNQANTERVEYMLDMLEIRGFTFFEDVQGRGSFKGEPRRGTHAWPEMRKHPCYSKPLRNSTNATRK